MSFQLKTLNIESTCNIETRKIYFLFNQEEKPISENDLLRGNDGENEENEENRDDYRDNDDSNEDNHRHHHHHHRRRHDHGDVMPLSFGRHFPAVQRRPHIGEY